MKIIKRLKGTGGFTLIEIVVVLGIIAVLAGILAPTLVRYVGDSRIRKAEADVRNIGAAIGMYYADTGHWPIWKNGKETTAGKGMYNILVTVDGAEPDKDSGVTDWPTLDDTNRDYLRNQLINNAPGSVTDYGYPIDGRRAWRGPYLEGKDVGADPWGSRYMVNVQFLHPDHVGGKAPVFVISAGPNKLVETDFDQTGPALAVEGDDIVFRIK